METNNPIVYASVINVIDVTDLKPKLINFHNFITNNFYVTSIVWDTKNQIEIELLNRLQNQSVLLICRQPSFNCSEVIAFQKIKKT